ncbi:MAG TPA: VanZ family protein [Longimicrobiales bacterium]|nr:VanZ family protein [Longimicrobiales bacterium]
MTLTPGGGGGTVTGLCIICGNRGLADFILNVGLFLPLGAALGWRGARFLTTAALVVAFTVFIETAQLSLIPGRDSNPGDVIANSVGGALGWWLLVRGRPLAARAGARGSWPALLATVVVLGLLTGGLQLTRPLPPDGTYYTQWAADFPHMGRFTGEVLSSRLGPLPLEGPPWRIERPDSVRQLLRARAPLEVRVVPDTVPWGGAPIFSIFEEREGEVLMLAQFDSDLVYRYRVLGSRFLLDQPELRAWNLLEEFEPGRPTTLTVRPDGRAVCLGVGTREQCGLAFSPGDTWMLLYAPDWLDPPLRRAVSTLWVLGLFLPAGAFVRRRRTAALSATLAVAGLALGPWVTGFPLAPVGEMLGAVAGVALGSLLTRR